MGGGKLDMDPLISHEFSIDDFEKGLKIADDSDQSIKVVLMHSGNPGPLDQVRDVGLRPENLFEVAVAKP